MEVNGQLHAPAVTIVWEAVWAPEPVWMLQNREISPAPAGNQTPAIQPLALAIPTELPQREHSSYS
jgi:hypothetical protein